MKKSTLVLLLLFVVSGGLTLWYLNRPEPKKTSLTDADADFAIENTDEIGKIFLANRIRGEQYLLERRGDEWFVQDTIKVYPLIMESMLTAMRNMRIKYRPAEAAVPNIIKALATDQVKTEIYDRQGNLMKTYYVGGETNDNMGTYMIMEGSEKPFVMEIPFVSGSFKVRFDLGLLELTDKAIFREDTEEIEYISMEYPTRRDESFVLDRSSGDIIVQPFYPTTPIMKQSPSKGSVERYLRNFEKNVSEAVVKNNMGRDRFSKVGPFAEFVLRRRDGSERRITFYPKDTTDPVTGLPVQRTEKLVAAVNGNYERMYLVPLLTTQKIFIGYESFF